jgi:hypothetical protein
VTEDQAKQMDPLGRALDGEKAAWARDHLERDAVAWLTTMAPDGRLQSSLISFVFADGELLLYSDPKAPRSAISRPRRRSRSTCSPIRSAITGSSSRAGRSSTPRSRRSMSTPRALVGTINGDPDAGVPGYVIVGPGVPVTALEGSIAGRSLLYPICLVVGPADAWIAHYLDQTSGTALPLGDQRFLLP